MIQFVDARRLVERLNLAFGQPFGATADNADDMVRTWERALSDCLPDDSAKAVDEYIRTQTRKIWPTPGAIREKALALASLRRRPVHYNHDERHPFCLSCNTFDLYETSTGRLRPLHRDLCPGVHETEAFEQRATLQMGASIWTCVPWSGESVTSSRLPPDRPPGP